MKATGLTGSEATQGVRLNMVTHLKVSLQLRAVPHADYHARVTTQVTDTCYKAKAIRLGLPPGMAGIPEYDYITAELTHEGERCGQIVTNVVQDIDGVKFSEGKTGVTVFVLVNGELAGSAHHMFPRQQGSDISLPIELDFKDASEAVVEHSGLAFVGTSCHDFDLLKIKGWPETKTVMERQCKTILGHKICADIPVIYLRSCELHVIASICHPDLAEIIGNVQECLRQAAIAGVIVGLVTESPTAGSAALTGYLKSCLLAKGVRSASEITASVNPHSQSCSEWHRKT